jgi:hypothetical protein
MSAVGQKTVKKTKVPDPDPPVEETTEEPQQEEPKKVGRKTVVRQHKIGTLLKECPMCIAKLVDASDVQGMASEKFFLVQHAANNDNTGYESYLCQYCKKQVMLVISASPILIQPQFQMGPLFGGGAPGEAGPGDPNQSGTGGAQPQT